MSNTDPLSTARSARTRPTEDPPRTIGGALVTAALLVTAVLAITAAPAVLVGLITATVAGLAAGFVVGVRSSRHAAGHRCLTRAGICLQL